MSTYCKAYLLEDLRRYPGWDEAANLESAADEPGGETNGDANAGANGGAGPSEAAEHDQPYLFLHDSYVVTRGVFVDEDVVFDGVTDEWKAFCANTLAFAIPH